MAAKKSGYTSLLEGRNHALLPVPQRMSMQSLREFLPAGFCEQMEKELGRQEALRLLWPAVVGSALGERTKPVALRGDTLVVEVQDKVWLNSAAAFEKQILAATARFWGKPVAAKIEFVCLARPVQQMPAEH